MSFYYYKVRDQNGKLIKDKIEKENEQSVKDFLKSKGYIILNVRKLRFFERDINLFQAKIRKEVLSIYCTQFSCMNVAGISLIELLEILQTQTSDKLLKKQIIFLRESLLVGETLSVSMKKTGKFPELLVNMTAVAEQNGELSSIYEKMSVRYKKEDKFEQDIKNAIAYPLSVAALLLIVVMVAVTILLPNFSRIYEANEAELPLATSGLIHISEFFTKNQSPIFIILILLISVAIAFCTTHKGKYMINKFLVKAPVVKVLYMKSVNAKFAGVLGLLLDSGYSVPEAMASAKKVLNNLFLDSTLDKIIAAVEKGDSLADAIRDAKIFDPALHRMIAIGEESGQLPYVLGKCSENFDEAMERTIAKTNKLIGPISVVVLGAVVGFVMLAIMLPVFNLGQIL